MNDWNFSYSCISRVVVPLGVLTEMFSSVGDAYVINVYSSTSEEVLIRKLESAEFSPARMVVFVIEIFCRYYGSIVNVMFTQTVAPFTVMFPEAGLGDAVTRLAVMTK